MSSRSKLPVFLSFLFLQIGFRFYFFFVSFCRRRCWCCCVEVCNVSDLLLNSAVLFVLCASGFFRLSFFLSYYSQPLYRYFSVDPFIMGSSLGCCLSRENLKVMDGFVLDEDLTEESLKQISSRRASNGSSVLPLCSLGSTMVSSSFALVSSNALGDSQESLRKDSLPELPFVPSEDCDPFPNAFPVEKSISEFPAVNPFVGEHEKFGKWRGSRRNCVYDAGLITPALSSRRTPRREVRVPSSFFFFSFFGIRGYGIHRQSKTRTSV